MDKGSINGVPIWVKSVDNTTTERTVVHEAPGVDGAVVETQGQGPQLYSVEFTLISDGAWITDDYDTATLTLRTAFLTGGPFTVTLPILGELTDLWLADPVTLKFYDETRLGISEGSVTFTEARPFAILQDNAVGTVQAASAALTQASAEDLAAKVPSGSALDGLIAILNKIAAWLSKTQGLINSAFEPVNAVSGAINDIQNSIEQLLATPQNFASQLAGTSAQLMSLVPSSSQQGSTTFGSAAVQDPDSDKPASVFVQSLLDGAAFDDGVPPTQGDLFGDDASAEDLAENEQRDAGVSVSLVAVTAGCCLAMTETQFATIDGVLAVAEALEPAFQRLFDLDNLDYRVYQNAVTLRAATLLLLSEQAIGLPRLRIYTATHDTNLDSLLPEIYDILTGDDQVQAAMDSVFRLNVIPDPTLILRGTTLRYLDPLAV